MVDRSFPFHAKSGSVGLAVISPYEGSAGITAFDNVQVLNNATCPTESTVVANGRGI